MVQIVGKYQYVSSENFEEYIKAMGQAEAVGPFVHSQPIVEVQNEGDQWTITVTNNGKTASSTFKLGQPYEEHLPSFSRTLQSVTTKEGEKFRTESQLCEDLKSIRIYEFTDTGMVVHCSSNKFDVTATRSYKRL